MLGVLWECLLDHAVKIGGEASVIFILIWFSWEKFICWLSTAKAEILLCVLDYQKNLWIYQRSLGSSRIRQHLKKSIQNNTSLSGIKWILLNLILELPLIAFSLHCPQLYLKTQLILNVIGTSFLPNKGRDWRLTLPNSQYMQKNRQKKLQYLMCLEASQHLRLLDSIFPSISWW